MLTANARKRRRDKMQRERRVKNRRLLMEGLEDRRLLAADFNWVGDALEISGSDQSDFIAVQQDTSGPKVFTEDAFYTEHQGRDFSTATSISVSGGAGNDVLFSYQASVPVSLSGDGGNDFLYSDKSADTLDGGDGFDWIYNQQAQPLWENAFGVEGLDLSNTNINGSPSFDSDNRIGMQVTVEGGVDLMGEDVDVSGVVNVDSEGVDVEVAGSIAEWNNAFGVVGMDLKNTDLTLGAGTDVHEGEGYRVDLTSDLDIDGVAVDVGGSVNVQGDNVAASLFGSIANWDDAFGVPELNLQNAQLAISGSTDGADQNTLGFGVDADMDIEGTIVAVAGDVSVAPNRIDANLFGSLASWTNAFGIAGLVLENSNVQVAAYTDRNDDYSVSVGLAADLRVEDTTIEISGIVDLAPDRIDAAFSGSVANWDDAFGIEGLQLNATDIGVIASTDRADENELRFDIDSNMDVEGTNVRVAGSVGVEPSRTSASLTGFVAAEWTDAFGIQGLTLKNTMLGVNAARDDDQGSELEVDIEALMDVSGTDVAVVGAVGINSYGVDGLLSGSVPGQWSDAFGVEALVLTDTTLGVSASKSAAGSEVSVGVQATAELLGEAIVVGGAVELTADGVRTSLTGLRSGEWIDAFGVDGLQFKDAGLMIAADTTSGGGLSIDLDTGLHLFGDYIDVSGSLAVGSTGISASFSPPENIDFTNLLGIPGFSLENAGLTVSVGTDGIEAAVAATMDMGNLDVDFVGEFAISKTEVQASLTGSVDSWHNAFEIAGLNLDDVVMTLGAESGALGASMFIGLGAGVNIGAKQLDVAGLVGFSATGWDVAFRGSINSLTSDDLIDFANTITQAADPDAAEIPEDALGDFEIRDAYINFAPKGGNEALGIDDGFGIGGEFYEDGERLATGEFAVDIEQGTFQVELDIPHLDLGAVTLSDVLVDIRIAPLDSHYKVAGTAELMGSSVHLSGELNADGTFALTGSANVAIDGLQATAVFTVDNSGVRFVATAQGAAVDAIKGAVTQDLRAVANDAQALIDAAQASVTQARAEVTQLASQLAEAREEAQEEVDKVKADLDAAKVVVDRAAASKSYWYSVRRSRYYAWRSAVATTNRAPWWSKPYYKSIEASKYASYASAAAVYSAKVVEYNATVAVYNAIRDAAGWALDGAGVDANPEVIRLTTLWAAANAVVTATEATLNAVEEANADALKLLDIADSLRVDKITISGNVSDYIDAGVAMEIDYGFLGGSYSLSLQADTDGLVDQIVSELAAALP